MSQNKLLGADMMFSGALCFVGFGGYIAGIFGMNLDNTITIQPIYGVFAVVFVLTFALMIVGSIALYNYYQYLGIVPRELVYVPKKSKKNQPVTNLMTKRYSTSIPISQMRINRGKSNSRPNSRLPSPAGSSLGSVLNSLNSSYENMKS